MTDDEIRKGVATLRQREREWHGPLQLPYWDLMVLIFDCEALLRGKETNMPREEIEAALERQLKVE